MVLERERLPRYKLCGGGLIGLSLGALPPGFTPPVRSSARRISLTYDLGAEVTRDAGGVAFPMVMRSELDEALALHARAQGARVVEGTTVTGLREIDGAVAVSTSAGEITAAAVVGADGSAGRTARHVGARFSQVDLGMERELWAPDGLAQAWHDRVLLDFGRVPGAYAWVFPKGDRLTVGAIASKGRSAEQRAYVDALVARLGLAGLEVAHEGGHLTRCRAQGSPLARGRVLLAGDAGGLLEPWTREGISYALRSGALAGAAAADLANGDDTAADAYAVHVESTMGSEMAVGARALRAYERHPGAFYRALAHTSIGWKSFVRLARGETTLARAGRRPVVRAALRSLGG